MRSISDTLAELQRLGPGTSSGSKPQGAVLQPLAAFGDNLGALRALLHVPTGLPAGAPLVVVLHGCTQTAEAYDRGSGWSALADRFGFAVLYAEQQRANNPNVCFNWFSPADIRRGGGETESIRQMIAAAIERHGIDRLRVFVTGLSAGGAMTSVMLATHPELFAGGAIIAGLPYGTAAGVPQALERMRGHGHDCAMLSQRVLAASPHRGPWPAVSVWHGTADSTVSAVNGAMIVDQWRGVHGVGEPDVVERIGAHLHRAWHDGSGRLVVEEFTIAGLGHGVPLAAAGDEACGTPGPHMLEAGISSTYRIAASWGIVPAQAPRRATSAASERPSTPASHATIGLDVSRTISDALRAAGLMRD